MRLRKACLWLRSRFRFLAWWRSPAASAFYWATAQNLAPWLIVLFLIPVSLMMHKFWTVSDPMMAQIQMILFMKNVYHARWRLVDFTVRSGAVQPGCPPLALNALIKERTKCTLNLNRRILGQSKRRSRRDALDQLFAKRGPTQRGSPSQCRPNCSTRPTN